MKYFTFGRLFLVLAIVALLFVATLFSAPAQFPKGTVFRVAQDESVSSVAERLFDEHIISSPKLFKSLLIFSTYDKTIQPGPYTFDEKQNIFKVAERLGLGIFETDFIKVTFPEGIPSTEMAKILKKNFENFDEELFVSLAKKEEGFLFPDTYYFDPETTPDAVISQLKSTFFRKTKSLLSDISDVHETITFASILEKEGRGEEQQKMIAGILLNRLEKGMLLQVDAPFVYLLGKESKDLTVEDLKLDNPYNTYVYKGLPPGPIGNPGLQAIEAALSPTQNEYLFYLHDNDGDIHYAKTFAEHVKNKKNYLK